ncbi:hypothetical protein [Priestia taiwanensis]|uniref:Uncharacterized protein n=1 Tax=Priestia taiwanensis TaxID=1347902 RepID=A0A917AYG9_9BACI|nr:hypothetical protein [Priestia taiwanensis]MBM7364446.1 hypothetical protein [Priestia taiwanensis]GGE81393.1 hypothetical protein GCM10007140_33730 [Priestia taiwanensis]
MLTHNTLRNIYKKDFEDFFRLHKVHRRSVRIVPETGQDRYTPIQNIITEELESQEKFSDTSFDEFMYQQLFYSINNWHYVYKNEDCIFNSNTSLEDVIYFLEMHPALNFNKPLTDNLGSERYLLCTTRIEVIDDCLKSINFLIKIGDVESNSENCYFFSAITIDLEHNLVIIRFNQNSLESFEEDPSDVLVKLKDLLNGASQRDGVISPFESLNLNVIGLNEEVSKRIISTLFKELSSEAEDILNARVPENTENDIREFLENKGLPCEEDYVQQIKSVLYQDISQTCADTIFANGWVFRFVFREGRLTRASSRTDDRSPIYGSKVYWHLKELIFKSEEMYEAGFLWYLENPGEFEEAKYVEVRLESRNDSLILHYYYKMRTSDRKEKEEFVLRKINSYF